MGTVLTLFQWPFSGTLNGLMIVFFGFSMLPIGLAYYLIFRRIMGWRPDPKRSLTLADLVPLRWRRRAKPVGHPSALWDRWVDGG